MYDSFMVTIISMELLYTQQFCSIDEREYFVISRFYIEKSERDEYLSWREGAVLRGDGDC